MGGGALGIGGLALFGAGDCTMHGYGVGFVWGVGNPRPSRLYFRVFATSNDSKLFAFALFICCSMSQYCASE
jgi:hypothetical protein